MHSTAAANTRQQRYNRSRFCCAALARANWPRHARVYIQRMAPSISLSLFFRRCCHICNQCVTVSKLAVVEPSWTVVLTKEKERDNRGEEEEREGNSRSPRATKGKGNKLARCGNNLLFFCRPLFHMSRAAHFDISPCCSLHGRAAETSSCDRQRGAMGRRLYTCVGVVGVGTCAAALHAIFRAARESMRAAGKWHAHPARLVAKISKRRDSLS